MKILTSADPSRSQPHPPPRKSLIRAALPFNEFVETALYDRDTGYYARISGGEDYATSGRISPVFGFALSRLVSEFVGKTGDGLCSIVDIGCGDGTLLESVLENLPERVAARCSLIGVDRAAPLRASERLSFQRDLSAIPRDLPVLVFSNELFDALPFARLVGRKGKLHELYVTGADGAFDWVEREARPEYVEYFERRGINLADGQYADVSLEWEKQYTDMCNLAPVAMIVTFDYGFPEDRLFDNRVRRYGTAAAYWRHQVHRDLLARPGEQDLTAHINFTDLMRAGESVGYQTLQFTRQAEFLLSIGITAHPLFAPAEHVAVESLEDAVGAMDEREAARRLVLPDGIGEDIRVLVQARGVPAQAWSFQQRPFARLTRPDRRLQ